MKLQRPRHYRMTSLAWSLITLWFMLGSSGCLLLLGAGAGAGGAAYVMGKLDAELDGTIAKVHGAALAGIKSLGMPVMKNQVDRLSATIESKTADDKNIWISIDFVTKLRSKISIRVGYLGNEVHSRQIFESIQKRI